MNQALIATLALLTISGFASAGATLHLEANANGEVHTIDATVGDDGSATLLVDGQPVEPGAPELPAIPTLP